MAYFLYQPLDFTAGEHTHQASPTPKLNPFDGEASSEEKEEKPAEPKQPVSAPSPAVPLAADQLKVETELPCPAPDAIPLGAKNKTQTAVIIGYKWNDEGRCEAIYEPLGIPTIIGNYLPGAPVVATTATIAAVATTAAIFAKPLGDFLLKAVKPTVKKAIKKIKERLGRKVPVESAWQRRKFQRALRK